MISLCAQAFDPKDPRIFTLASPKLGASAYKRVFDPVQGVCPRPDRIVQDMHKVVHACKEIYKARGVFVPGLAGGRVAGHRHTKTTRKTSNNWGGKRTRLEYECALDEKSMHEDLKALMDGSEDLQSFFVLDDSGSGNEGEDSVESEVE